MKDLSLLIVCKDEYEKVYSIINDFESIIDEAVVVITGNRKKFIYKDYNEKIVIVKTDLEDDYSSASNIGLDNCSGKWIFKMNVNEEIDESSIQRVSNGMLYGNANDIYGFETEINLYTPQETSDPATMDASFYRGYSRCIQKKCIRLFRNDKRIRYKYNINENLYYTIDREGLKRIDSNILIHSWQYLAVDDEYIRLCIKRLENNPDDIESYYTLGKAYDIVGNYETSLKYYTEGHNKFADDNILLYCLLLENKIKKGR